MKKENKNRTQTTQIKRINADIIREDQSNQHHPRSISPNWSWVKLGDVCEIIMGQSPPSSTYNNKKIGLPFFQGKAEFTELYPEVIKWCSEPQKIAEPLDILVSVRAPVGSTNIANQKCCIGRGLAAIRYSDCHKFIFYFFRLIEKDLDNLGTGTTFKAISGKILNELPIPLPPLPVQHKIVGKIEELFSELDSGVANLRKAKEQIKIYRQSVLAYAFSGKLTQELRIDNGELKIEKDNSQLPSGWKCVKLGEILNVSSGKGLTSANMQDNGKYSVYGGNGINGYYSKYLFEESKLILGRVGAKCGVVHITKPKSWVTDNALIVYFKQEVNINFFYHCLTYHNLNKLSVSTAQPVISGAKIYPYEILFPPLETQHHIVSEIERRFSVADKLAQTIEESLKKAEQLKQSILKRAFEGKLT
ncbi:MAG: restriction endonuclease subunit S [Ignavibacteriales bacterium]|nr:restriction endonuclease subunit S [Ignavibacteriales bacterium]